MRQQTSCIRRAVAVAAVLASSWTLLACGGRAPGAEVAPLDESIASEVLQRLDRASSVDASTIQVRVVDGVVELSGVVRSAHEAREAIRVAARARGVRQVVNRLLIVESDLKGRT